MSLTDHERAVLAFLEEDLARADEPKHSRALVALALLAMAVGFILVFVGSAHLVWLSALGALLAAASPFLAAVGCRPSGLG